MVEFKDYDLNNASYQDMKELFDLAKWHRKKFIDEPGVVYLFLYQGIGIVTFNGDQRKLHAINRFIIFYDWIRYICWR